ncbi:endothelin-converting enzyme, metalloprotease family M13 [Thraustotheca clavata]|uniref:Endothelin-converting enzyme, metalloprotease family M13 n=1 Tax=Thraustotheca clavata TaxID=74557 RepID=A0A1W0A458_9STRA|nr:endothelin-converting enzyme, metalloprotease family M13 [Thraustotheca clavata]
MQRHDKLGEDEDKNEDTKGFKTMAIKSSSNARKGWVSSWVSPFRIVIIVFVLVGFVSIMITFLPLKKKKDEQIDQLPRNVQLLMDESIDPCTDFYQYACGTWIKNMTLPNDRSRYTRSFNAIQDANDAIFHDIVNEKWPLLSELYLSCMDTNMIDVLGSQPLKKDLIAIENAPDKASLFQVVGELSSRSSASFLIDTGIFADEKNTTIYSLHVSQGGLTLPDQEYYTNDTRFSLFKPDLTTFITKLLTLSEWNSSVDDAVQDIIQFEIELANCSMKKELLRDPLLTYNPQTNINTTNPLLLGHFFVGAGIPLTKESTVIIATPSYLKLVENLVNKTPLEKLKTFFAYQYISSVASSLSTPYRDAVFELFGRKIQGQATPRPRQKQCLARVDAYLGELLSRYYIQTTFKLEALTLIKSLVSDLIDAFQTRLEQASWMDKETRSAAVTKLHKMTALLGYPVERREYPNLALANDKHFSNVQQLIHYHHLRAVSKLGTAVNPMEWMMDAHEVNAYYSPMANQIVFPAGILQPPFFDPAVNPAQNYGAIGMVIGHEITHGFDDQGRNFDGSGNMHPWWTNSTATKFNSRARCISNQYSSMVVRNDTSGELLGHVNGAFTLGEDIADIGGLRIAFEAYKEHLFPSKMTLAMEKLFFLSYAQSWCTKATDQSIKAHDVHPPPKQRVNGAIMNNEEFARIFVCPNTALLNPQEKCNI